MSVTYKQLVDETSAELHGLTTDLEQVTYLTADINATATTLSVGDATQISTGLIEVDDELLWVIKTDATNNTVTVAPFGRGFRNSGAASHTANTMIIDNPRFPRSSIKDKIQQALSEAYPEVFTVKNDESNTANPVQVTYPLPADCDVILQIRSKTTGPSGTWMPVKAYNADTSADTTAFPTGRSVDIKDGMFPGQKIRVTYIARPTAFVADTDTLDSIGLDDNLRDVIVYGACYRLISGVEVARMQTTSVPQSDRDQLVPVGSATKGAQWYQALFEARLQNERDRLLKIHKSFTHMSR